MADVTLWGASYSGVSGVSLPATGGGTATFPDVSDTTATAADVAEGKYFYTSQGTRTQGIGSGGGGASNVVHGSFTVGTTQGAAETHTIGYSGSGYPIAMLLFIKGGPYNNTTATGDIVWYNSTQRYAIGVWGCIKANTSTTPTWATSGAANQYTTFGIYKNSTSTATSYSRTSAMNTVVTSSSSASAGGSVANSVKFKGNNHTISVFVASTSYGLLAGHEYEYYIVYSE